MENYMQYLSSLLDAPTVMAFVLGGVAVAASVILERKRKRFEREFEKRVSNFAEELQQVNEQFVDSAKRLNGVLQPALNVRDSAEGRLVYSSKGKMPNIEDLLSPNKLDYKGLRQ